MLGRVAVAVGVIVLALLCGGLLRIFDGMVVTGS